MFISLDCHDKNKYCRYFKNLCDTDIQIDSSTDIHGICARTCGICSGSGKNSTVRRSAEYGPILMGNVATSKQRLFYVACLRGRNMYCVFELKYLIAEYTPVRYLRRTRKQIMFNFTRVWHASLAIYF